MIRINILFMVILSLVLSVFPDDQSQTLTYFTVSYHDSVQGYLRVDNTTITHTGNDIFTPICASLELSGSGSSSQKLVVFYPWSNCSVLESSGFCNVTTNTIVSMQANNNDIAVEMMANISDDNVLTVDEKYGFLLCYDEESCRNCFCELLCIPDQNNISGLILISPSFC